ncbi:GNAT family N-acetyltransferase [Aureibacillus halotolerans]|uniref:GNAT family N-acetyltransferase n=1 Tax=Aureibacillus halotolerans TaxID=1508390 RepID=UPI00105CF70B
MGPAYRFPQEIRQPAHDTVLVNTDNAQLLEQHFSSFIPDLAQRQPCAAVVQNDQAVAVCFCARTNDEASEAGLETHIDFRGRGFGQAVVLAWALAVRKRGRSPLYSTSWDNIASQALAKKLGLVQYGTVLHFR